MHTNARQWKSCRHHYWYNIYTYSTMPGHTHLSAWISISTLYWFTLCFNCCCWPWVLCSQRDLSRLLVLVHPVSIASAGQSTCKKWMVSLSKPMLNLFKVFDYYWLPSPWIFSREFHEQPLRNLQSKWPVQAIGSTDVHADAILLKPRKGPSSIETWTLMKNPSSGAEVRVKGCHSPFQPRRIYWPAYHHGVFFFGGLWENLLMLLFTNLELQ